MTGLASASLGSVFVELDRAFEQAAAGVAVRTHRLRLGAQALELRIAGEAMAAGLLPALRHLEVPGPAPWEPDLVVKAWDTAGSGTRLPDLADLRGHLGRSERDGEVLLSFRILDSALSSLHLGRGEALHCVADARQLAPYDIAHPMSEIFGWWLSRSGCYPVHGAAVGTAAGGVLLAGRSGAGKSTSALTCLRAGMHFAGDDAVLVQTEPPVAFSLYGSGRADRTLLALYPDVLPRLEVVSGDEKMVGFFSRETMTHQLPLRAVVLPRVVPGGSCRLAPERKGVALLALAPWVSLHSAGAGEVALNGIRHLLSALPVYALQVGDDLERLPGLLADLIDASG